MKSAGIIAGLAGLAAAIPFVAQRNTPPSYSSKPVAHLKNGTVEGYHQEHYNHDYFLGVPFAQPPVDRLRFRNPQSINSSFGHIEAKEYAPECLGYGGDQLGYPVSEDCLYLNIIRPAGYEGQSLPIGVWIHGGGLTMGGTRDLRYNGSLIVENSVKIGKPIIFVSIAYRLAVWGFVAGPEISGSGNTNLGLKDQRLGLHWLQENIEAFGGDKSKVTIWGESAGAASVGWHITAFNGRDDGLFRAGIMQSGNPVNYGAYKYDYSERFQQVLNVTGCTTAGDKLDCLRSIPIDTLNPILNSTGNAEGWGPIVDGDLIQRWASVQLEEGAFVKVPIIDGSNTDEGTSFSPRGINSSEDLAAAMTNTNLGTPLPAYLADEALAAYPNTPDYFIPPVEELPADYVYPPSAGSQYRRAAAYFGDLSMNANRRGACEAWAKHGLDAYSYRFNTIPNGMPPSVGVTHFQEVAFVFDNTEGYGYDALHGTVNPFGNKSEAFSDLAELMSSSWVSFIYDLDPNSFQGRYPAAEPWPKYSLENPMNIVWDANETELAVVEPDTYRQEGIRFILDHAKEYMR
ncbi:carboxylesterase family protein [Zymoseptoria brevis]|uniref:Carboxylic ester hydrolase n=1 Tax=Zymoseptoria brevis TaxID=1047168 RepID=A0A0F4GEC9_9PEZI|nr:carboxylesterase family protein [Zymoseptoria brevis]